LDIPVADPIDEAGTLARYAIDPAAGDGGIDAAAGSADSVPGDSGSQIVTTLSGAARLEADRIAQTRRWSDPAELQTLTALDLSGPWLMRARRRRTRILLRDRVVAIARIDRDDQAGRLVHATLVPIAIAPAGDGFWSPRDLLEWLRALTSSIEACADGTVADGDSADDPLRAFARVRLARERSILAHARTLAAAPSLRQPGLFDRRAERAWLAARGAAEDAVASFLERVRLLEEHLAITPRPAQLMLVVAP
jgi:hypothetical protein